LELNSTTLRAGRFLCRTERGLMSRGSGETWPRGPTATLVIRAAFCYIGLMLETRREMAERHVTTGRRIIADTGN
jgi:hypothetical protein